MTPGAQCDKQLPRRATFGSSWASRIRREGDGDRGRRGGGEGRWVDIRGGG